MKLLLPMLIFLIGVQYLNAEEISVKMCGSDDDAVAELTRAQIDTWKGEHPNVKVMLDFFPWSSCQENISTLASIGLPPDIAYVGGRTIPNFSYQQLISPITLSPEQAKQYNPQLLNALRYKDQLWGIPRAYSTKALVWNKDLLASVGIDPETPPRNWLEWRNWCKQLSSKEGIADLAPISPDS